MIPTHLAAFASEPENERDGEMAPLIVTTPQGKLLARKVILATNAYTTQLLPELTPYMRSVTNTG